MKKIVLVLSLGLFLTGCGKAPSKVKDETKASSVTQVSSTSETSTPKEEIKEMEIFEAGSLIQAVMNNDIELTKRILEDKTYNINEVNQQNESALLIATHNNFVEIAKVLIDHG
ncbi:ankyrin repeat domain-containing protein, partial [Vagococcus fluvialis]|uniref:ankyrin repeat domain-containing protein n=1 Tax=Vagococcus fluvialis TaxID=2738 RepID=UPI003D1365D8